jgi:hypothetical protein
VVPLLRGGAVVSDYRIERGGGYYVVDRLSGEAVSPPLATREAAWLLAQQIAGLPAAERALLRAGKRVAPGCEFLIHRSVAQWTAREEALIAHELSKSDTDSAWISGDENGVEVYVGGDGEEVCQPSVCARFLPSHLTHDPRVVARIERLKRDVLPGLLAAHHSRYVEWFARNAAKAASEVQS